jgi:hypothetical protein
MLPKIRHTLEFHLENPHLPEAARHCGWFQFEQAAECRAKTDIVNGANPSGLVTDMRSSRCKSSAKSKLQFSFC